MVRQRRLTRFLNGLGALALLLGIAAQVFFPGKAFAASFTGINLTLSSGTITSDVNGDGIPDGGSMPGGSANYLFNFTDPDATNVNAIVFEFCTTEQIATLNTTCTAPTGMNANNANLTLGKDDSTGWTIDTTNSTANKIIVSGTATSLSGAAQFRLDSIVNPTTANSTFYAYITTYSTGYTGAVVDSGSTAVSTANPIVISGTMPETLVFCTARYIDINGSNVPDCTSISGETNPSDISFNQLFDPNETAWATSQMAAATNAGTGYAITVDGPTLSAGACASGNTGGDCIDPMSSADISRNDTRQFGMNLIDDSVPTYKEPDGSTAIAADPTIGPSSTNPITYYESDGTTTDPNGAKLYPVSDGNNFTGVQDTGFIGQWPNGTDNTGDTANYPTYKFVPNTATLVASSDWTNASGYVHASGSGGPTDTQRYTVTYIANVSGNQPAGTYTTTLTYICTPTF